MTIVRTNKELSAAERYHLTMSPAIQKMKDVKGANITVSEWCIYEDTDKDDKPQTILSILTKEGKIFATNSRTFINDFVKMWELFEECGETVNSINVTSGFSNANREYITCVYAD